MYQRSYLDYKQKGERDFNTISSLMLILTWIQVMKAEKELEKIEIFQII